MNNNDNLKNVWNKLHSNFKQDEKNILNYDTWLEKYSDVINKCQSKTIDLGDNNIERETNIEEAFKLEERMITDSNIKVKIPKTSCKILKTKI